MSWRSLMSPAFLVTLLILLGSTAGLRAAIKANNYYLRKLPIEAAGDRKLHTLPSQVGEWRAIPSASDRPLSQEVLETLGTENYVSRMYQKRFGDHAVTLELHCAYYTGMVDTVPHVPERCFIGGGMAQASGSRLIQAPVDMSRFSPDPDVDGSRHGGKVYVGYAESEGSRVRMPVGLETLTMNVTRFKQGSVDVYAGYFFIANGGTVPRAEDVRMRAFNLTDDYAYYLKVQVTSASVGSEEELAAMAADLLNDMLPEIMLRAPDWVEVTEGRYPADNPRAARGA